MRKTLLSIILVLTAALAMAKKVQAIDRPTWLSSDAGKSLTVTRVEFTDTATVVSFHSKYKPKWWIKISQLSYLIGDDGNRYRARTGIGIKLGDEFYMPESGEADFKVCFEPMPRKTRYVDFIEGPSGWRIWGIHQNGSKATKPVATPYNEAKMRITDEAAFFRKGKGVIHGHFEGTHPEILNFYGDDPVTQADKPQVFDVAADGTFTVELDLDYPILNSLVGADRRLYYFYLCPGDTVEMTISADDYVSCPDGTRYRNLIDLMSNAQPQTWLDYDKTSKKAKNSTLAGYTAWLVEQTDKNKALADYIAAKFKLTDEERHLLQTTTNLYCGYSIGMYEDLNKDNTVMSLADYSHIMRRMPFDDLTCLSCPSMSSFINRYQFSSPIFYRKALAGETGHSINKVDTIRMGNDSTAMAAEREMMGVEKPSLFLQLAWNNIRSNKTDYTVNPEGTRQKAAERQKLMTSGYLRSNLARQMASFEHPQTTVRELPAGQGTDIFNNIIGKYRGKFVLVDFWGTGCGPCRHAIEHSRQLRDSIATLNDIELVFITSEDWSPKKAYEEYVAKNLASEESYRIPKTDWLRLLSLFGFNGIPHYELVAPDGKIITTDLNVGYNHQSDFNLFKDQFEKLKADIGL